MKTDSSDNPNQTRQAVPTIRASAADMAAEAMLAGAANTLAGSRTGQCVARDLCDLLTAGGLNLDGDGRAAVKALLDGAWNGWAQTAISFLDLAGDGRASIPTLSGRKAVA